jgi:hypothetical protein
MAGHGMARCRKLSSKAGCDTSLVCMYVHTHTLSPLGLRSETNVRNGHDAVATVWTYLPASADDCPSGSFAIEHGWVGYPFAPVLDIIYTTWLRCT